MARVLVVTDSFLVQSGLVARVERDLRAGGIHFGVFAGVQPDPTEANVSEGLRLFAECAAEAVIALGGGSPIDCGKAVALLTANQPPRAAIWADTSFRMRELH